jgi:hypothetical protein
MRTNLDDNKTYGLRLGPKTVFESTTTVAATSLSAASPPMVFLGAAGAVNLPPSDPAVAAASPKGQVFIFANLTAGAIAVQTSAGGAFTTAISVGANASARVVCTGSPTAGLGWVIW